MASSRAVPLGASLFFGMGVIDNLPVRDVLRCHFGELLQQDDRQRKISNCQDAAVHLPGKVVDLFVIFIAQAGSANDDMGAALQRGQDICFRRIRFRIFDKDIGMGLDCLCSRSIYGCRKAFHTDDFSQRLASLVPGNCTGQLQVIRGKDALRQCRAGPTGCTGDTYL